MMEKMFVQILTVPTAQPVPAENVDQDTSWIAPENVWPAQSKTVPHAPDPNVWFAKMDSPFQSTRNHAKNAQLPTATNVTQRITVSIVPKVSIW